MELQDVVNRLRMKQSIKAIKHETGKHRSIGNGIGMPQADRKATAEA